MTRKEEEKRFRKIIENNFLIFQPQSQINKCNNEKRRREQENEYIEQLGEFLQINKRDMTSSKPDKAAILNEVVKTVSFLLFLSKIYIERHCGFTQTLIKNIS